MLNKKIFRKIDTIGNNNYYIFPTVTEDLYTVETFLTVKGWFGRTKELTVGMMMLALNSIVVSLLLKQSEIEVVDEKTIDGDAEHSEKIYKRIDLKKFRTEFKELMKQVPETNIKVTGVTSNDVVKELTLEGHYMLAVEEIGTHQRQVWLAKSNDYGVLTITNILLGGRKATDEVIAVRTFVFTKELAQKTLEGLKGE